MVFSITTGEHAPTGELRRFLDALYGPARSGLLVELRLRAGAGMTQRFLPVDRLDEVRQVVLELAPQTDLYVGVLPRWRAQGARRDVGGGARVVWADCDGDGAVRALAAFRRPPSIIVRSGSGGNRHAYWLLDRRATVAEVQRANRRLALALGADAGSAEAARILRPPATLNHKHAAPVPVVLEVCVPERRAAGARRRAVGSARRARRRRGTAAIAGTQRRVARRGSGGLRAAADRAGRGPESQGALPAA